MQLTSSEGFILKTVDGTSNSFNRKILLILTAAIAAIALIISSISALGSDKKLPDGYDPAGREGMLFSETYEGEKNSPSTLSYRINSAIELENGAAKGAFMIENPAKNVIDLTVKIIYKDGDSEYLVYESGLLPPNSHIMYDFLDTPLDEGTYPCYALITGFDPDNGKELGHIQCDVNIVVNK